ncbi:hypothetical protein GCK72_011259 [Caenorhabditis remanei]|uniref:Seven TM Receptor n=1 Tax=Caenorhabditis remanei TaxID=31234 RepID=A0A6A5H868_CAERE|nr:hypothetical protein GCK72_011259 [Caenorhabditis remanei]KAF1762994.1 hypothetical protein GCK72_011259 [Caenorhabditis remanei]
MSVCLSAMKTYFQYSNVFTKIGFGAGFITNIFLIYLTVFHVKKIVGTYKTIVISFAIMGIVFAGWELVSRPFMHNYDKALVYFSLADGTPQFFQFSIAFYAMIYMSILSFIAVQFVYRYLALFNLKIAQKFDGNGVFGWLGYPIIPGMIYGSSFYLYCQPDADSDDFVRQEMLYNYELAIGEVPRFVIVSYNSDGTLRWKNMCFLVQGVAVIGLHYAVIIYFGLKMHFNMKSKLKDYSTTYRRLQNQFFRALVVQTMAPTIMFVIPAGCILLGPLFSPIFGIHMSLQTGWLCSVFSLYPPIDSIAFMIIVTEYKKIIKGEC